MKKRFFVKALSVLLCTTLITGMEAVASLPVKAADIDTQIVEEVDDISSEEYVEAVDETMDSEMTDSSSEIMVEDDTTNNNVGKQLSSLSIGKEGYKLTEDTVVDGDVVVSSTGVLDLNGYKLTVEGNVIAIGSSSIQTAKSSLVVKGNMIFSDDDIQVSSSIYTDESSVINVYKDFLWNSSGQLLGVNAWTERGIINIKGNYTDKYGSRACAVVKIVGEGEHQVQLKKNSLFYSFRTDEDAIIVAPIFNTDYITSDVVIKGNVKVTKYLCFGETNKKLTIKGNLDTVGYIDARSATLNIEGNLIFEDEGKVITAELFADDDTVVNVDGDFKWNSSGWLFRKRYGGGDAYGSMNLKGNYYDKNGSYFGGTLHMLSKSATISSSNVIRYLILAGPKEGYTFLNGVTWKYIKIEDDTPAPTPAPTASPTPGPVDPSPTPGVDPTPSPEPGVDPTPSPAPTPEVQVEEYTIKLDRNTGGEYDDYGTITVKKPGVYEMLWNPGNYDKQDADGRIVKHVFIGWFTEREGGVEINVGDVVDVVPDTLYAHYITEGYEEITIKLDANGYGTIDNDSITVTNPGVYRWVSAVSVVSNREGLSFDGWYTAPDGGTKVVEGMKVNPEWTTLYARYSRTVTFDYNGGYVDNPTEQIGKIIVPGKYVNLPKPKRAYYIFDGWNIGAPDGKQVNEGDIINAEDLFGFINMPIPLYAHYSHETNMTTDQIIVGQKYSIASFVSDIGIVKKYKVTSTNGGKASVSKKGIITAKKPGTVVITPIFKNGATGYTITAKISKPVLTTKKLLMSVGSENSDLASLLLGVPADNIVGYYIKTSSKKPVIKLENGKITALKKGKAKLYIDVFNAQNKSKRYTVTISVK